MPDSVVSAGAATRRLFFALWPDATTAEALHALARTESERCGGRAMRRDTVHLTLAFLGDLPAARFADAVAAANALTASVPPALFALPIDRLGYWRHNRIRWAGCATVPDALIQLAARLARELRSAGFGLEARAFAPHITLLRHAEHGDDAAPTPVIAWPVHDFVLAESCRDAGGARYVVRQRWPLAGGAA